MERRREGGRERREGGRGRESGSEREGERRMKETLTSTAVKCKNMLNITIGKSLSLTKAVLRHTGLFGSDGILPIFRECSSTIVHD